MEKEEEGSSQYFINLPEVCTGVTTYVLLRLSCSVMARYRLVKGRKAGEREEKKSEVEE